LIHPSQLVKVIVFKEYDTLV